MARNILDQWIDNAVYKMRRVGRRLLSRGLAEPCFDFGNLTFQWHDDPAYINPTYNWNNEFIEYLRRHGYEGETEQDVVQDWLMEIYSNALYEDEMDGSNAIEAPMQRFVGRKHMRKGLPPIKDETPGQARARRRAERHGHIAHFEDEAMEEALHNDTEIDLSMLSPERQKAIRKRLEALGVKDPYQMGHDLRSSSEGLDFEVPLGHEKGPVVPVNTADTTIAKEYGRPQ